MVDVHIVDTFPGYGVPLAIRAWQASFSQKQDMLSFAPVGVSVQTCRCLGPGLQIPPGRQVPA
jgi:hypothetical protein